jgi:hypothetical protein
LYIRTKTLVIYRSAWKGNSANFALTEFSEVMRPLAPPPISKDRPFELDKNGTFE